MGRLCSLRWIVTVLCLLSIGSGTAAANRPLSVFVSILPQRYFVERIAGNEVQISVMVRPGADPATYEPSPQQMADLAHAQAYFSIGVPFEAAWLGRIEANHPQLMVVDTREGIALRQIEGHRHGSPSAGGNEEHLLDPHIWLSPRLVRQQAESIYQALAALNPTQAPVYFRNYQLFLDDLQILDGEIRGIVGSGEGGKFMVFHPAWGYFADEYGLQQIPIELEGKEPTAKELTQIIDLARREKIKVIFVQSQFNVKPAKTVANAVGARIVRIDPLAEDYIDNMVSMARAISEALK